MGETSSFRGAELRLSNRTTVPHELLSKMHDYRNCDEQNEYCKQQGFPISLCTGALYPSSFFAKSVLAVLLVFHY